MATGSMAGVSGWYSLAKPDSRMQRIVVFEEAVEAEHPLDGIAQHGEIAAVAPDHLVHAPLDMADDHRRCAGLRPRRPQRLRQRRAVGRVERDAPLGRDIALDHAPKRRPGGLRDMDEHLYRITRHAPPARKPDLRIASCRSGSHDDRRSERGVRDQAPTAPPASLAQRGAWSRRSPVATPALQLQPAVFP
jgi:hypothetical protein